MEKKKLQSISIRISIAVQNVSFDVTKTNLSNKEQPKLNDGVYRNYSLGTMFPSSTILNLNATFLRIILRILQKRLYILMENCIKRLSFQMKMKKLNLMKAEIIGLL